MNIPTDLLYTKSHEWVRFLDDTTARMGLTDFAQSALGGIVYVGLPSVDDDAVKGESFADVESVKSVADIYSPVAGTVSAVNEELGDAPETINDAPYDAWLVEISGITDKGELLSSAEYEALCQEEE